MLHHRFSCSLAQAVDGRVMCYTCTEDVGKMFFFCSYTQKQILL